MERGRLGRQNYSLELLAELVAGVHHFVANVLGGHLPRQRVSDEHQFVGAEDDELAVRHEDPRGLCRAEAAEERVNGVEEGDVMGLTLVVVEAQQLPVLRAHAAAGAWEALGGLPLGDVVLHGLCDFLFQQLELTQLQGRKKPSLLRMRRCADMEINQGSQLKCRDLHPSVRSLLDAKACPVAWLS